jgi:hypothetical protein
VVAKGDELITPLGKVVELRQLGALRTQLSWSRDLPVRDGGVHRRLPILTLPLFRRAPE